MNKELQRAIRSLRQAVDYIEFIYADKGTDAAATGARRDAREWLEEAARAVVAAASRESGE